MLLYRTGSGELLFYGMREMEKGQLSKVYSSISDACSQGKRYCYINFYLTDRVKELLINDGFRIQVESYDMWYYYIIRWGKVHTFQKFLDRVHSFLKW